MASSGFSHSLKTSHRSGALSGRWNQGSNSGRNGAFGSDGAEAARGVEAGKWRVGAPSINKKGSALHSVLVRSRGWNNEEQCLNSTLPGGLGKVCAGIPSNVRSEDLERKGIVQQLRTWGTLEAL